jgi:hypothetical protein
MMAELFETALTNALNPGQQDDFEAIALLTCFPEQLHDGVAFSMMIGFSTVPIAVTGDKKLFERVAPTAELAQRILFLGCRRTSPETLLILTA